MASPTDDWLRVGTTSASEATSAAPAAALPVRPRRFCPWCSLEVMHYDGQALGAAYRSLCNELEDSHKPPDELERDLDLLNKLAAQALTEVPDDARSAVRITFRVAAGRARAPPPPLAGQAAASAGAADLSMRRPFSWTSPQLRRRLLVRTLASWLLLLLTRPPQKPRAAADPEGQRA